MAERTYQSNHISMKDMPADQALAVLADIELYNRIVHTAVNKEQAKKTPAGKSTGGPDLRKKENRELKEAAPKSLHVTMKENFGTDDYFTVSAIGTAKAAIQSVKELNAQNIEDIKSRISDLRQKRSSVDKTQKRLEKEKAVLKKASKDVRAGRKPEYNLKSANEKYDPDTGKFLVMAGKKVLKSYENAYLFELLYVDPKIRWCKHTLILLDDKELRLVKRVEQFEAEPPGICFGTRKLFKKQYDHGRYQNHDTWLGAFRKQRAHTLQISGRRDAVQGNFLFRYDPAAHTLSYRTQQKDAAGNRITAVFPNVVFPYGQEEVNKAVSAPKQTRMAVAWRIVVDGRSFRIMPSINVQPETELNNYFGDGCIAMDTNYDNLSVCELDGSGNVVRHKVIRFDLEGKSSGCAGQTLSTALDQAFAWCDEAKKPFAMEDLALKHVANHYSSRRKNFATSRFAFSKVTQLAESKALKHGVEICKVNPAYTSQAGKLLFIKKYGCSIHEGASIAIGRRALGIRERLPAAFRRGLKPDRQLLPVFLQWKTVYKTTKKLDAGGMYRYSFV